MAFFSFLSVIFALGIKVNSMASRPNIVHVWFDDLGFGDVSYNGGPYPTQLLDMWSSTNAIKLNWHYSEQVCSASRSAFLTGRFSWRSGLNTVTTARSDLHFDRSLTLFPERLQARGYNGYYAGKWHVGYKYEDCLPHHRGFIDGMYGHAGTQYYSRGNKRSFDFFDEAYYCPENAPVCNKRINKIGNRMATHDMWTIEYNDGTGEYEEVPILHNNEEYNEMLYTDGIISFIEQQDEDTPFYIQYNLFTPHSNLAEPPTEINNATVDYSMCDDPALQLQYEKELFCRQMQYAQLMIDSIMTALKKAKLWSNTLMVITSDNGASVDATNGLAGGQTLPLRGIKYGVNEGGIRTPAMLKGGFIRDLLDEWGTSLCEYNDIIHISDWYHIFLDAADIKTNRASITDSDHDLELWEHIKCSCNSTCNETQYDKREQFMTMRICGDPQGTDDEKYFYSTFIRDGDWKLVVNGSFSVVDGCPPDQNASNLTSYNVYNGGNFSTAGSRWFPIPEQNYFNDIYTPALEQDLLRDERLYQSQCLEAINGTERLSRPDKNDQYWAPSVFWLFNISDDKVEACNLAEEYPAKVTELFDIIKARSVEYNGQLDIVPSVGAMYMQLASWNCDYDTTYLKPWGDEDASINDACQTGDGDEEVDDRRCTELWNVLVDTYDACPTYRRRQLADGDQTDVAGKLTVTLYCVVLMLSALGLTL